MKGQIRRRAVGVTVSTAMTVGLLTGSAAADPPPNSGAVERFMGEGFSIIPDPGDGYWIFRNITREGFCTWIAGGEEGPPPWLDLNSVQLVDT